MKPVTALQSTLATPLHACSAEQCSWGVRRNRHRESGAAAYDVRSPGFVKGAGAKQHTAMALLAERTTGETFTLELKAYRQGVVRALSPSRRTVAQPPDLTRVSSALSQSTLHRCRAVERERRACGVGSSDAAAGRASMKMCPHWGHISPSEIHAHGRTFCWRTHPHRPFSQGYPIHSHEVGVKSCRGRHGLAAAGC